MAGTDIGAGVCSELVGGSVGLFVGLDVSISGLLLGDTVGSDVGLRLGDLDGLDVVGIWVGDEEGDTYHQL
jgi:hypothetical protein